MGRTGVDVRRTEQRWKEAAWVHLLKCMTFIGSYWADWNGDEQERGRMRSAVGFSPRSWPACQLALIWMMLLEFVFRFQLEAFRVKAHTHWVFFFCVCVLWGKRKVWLERQAVIRNINASIIEICGFILCLWIEQDDKQESAGALKKKSLLLWAECYDGKHANHYLLLLCWIYYIYY